MSLLGGLQAVVTCSFVAACTSSTTDAAPSKAGIQTALSVWFQELPLPLKADNFLGFWAATRALVASHLPWLGLYNQIVQFAHPALEMAGCERVYRNHGDVPYFKIASRNCLFQCIITTVSGILLS
jgi:hypothetical protein